MMLSSIIADDVATSVILFVYTANDSSKVVCSIIADDVVKVVKSYS